MMMTVTSGDTMPQLKIQDNSNSDNLQSRIRKAPEMVRSIDTASSDAHLK